MSRAAPPNNGPLEAVLAEPPRRPGRPAAYELPALWALFTLTLRQLVRGRRLLVLVLLYLIPVALALTARLVDSPAPPDILELALLFALVPHALVPLTALLYAGSVIQDEVEEQTLTYLLTRPLPRWALYGVKLLAAWLISAGLTLVFTTLTYAAVFLGSPELWGTVLPGKALLLSAILALALFAYCGVFGLIGILTRRSLIVGVGYMLLLEGAVANIDFVARSLTVVYYVRILSARWLDVNPSEWSLDLFKVPGTLGCVLTLLAIGLATTLLAMSRFASGEFRVKTPEGS
jgi:ABC-2 type transport system permease protein